MSNKFKVGNKEISEDSVVTTNLKTIFWFLGIISSIIMGMLVYFYLNLNTAIHQNEELDIERVKKMKKEVLVEIKEISGDMENLEDDVWEIKGDVKLLLDRTTGGSMNSPSPQRNQRNQNVPESEEESAPPILDSLPTNQ